MFGGSLSNFGILVLLLLLLNGCATQNGGGTDAAWNSAKGVAVKTDKAQYRQGDVINITVKNGLGSLILYYGGGDRFWGVEYYKNDAWTNPDYERGGGFQLTEEKIGGKCFATLFERKPPYKLSSGSNITSQWNQKICPLGTGGPDEPKIVRYAGSGLYRLVFYYGFEPDGTDPSKILDYKTVYSNEFAIE